MSSEQASIEEAIDRQARETRELLESGRQLLQRAEETLTRIQAQLSAANDPAQDHPTAGE